jgi:hypothetical protein
LRRASREACRGIQREALCVRRSDDQNEPLRRKSLTVRLLGAAPFRIDE